MTILFYTTGLIPGRERLMPWRTVIEVAKEMQRRGHEVFIINGVATSEDTISYKYEDICIQDIRKDTDELSHIAVTLQADALFVECKWRDGIKGFKPLRNLSCRKFAYFTGGVYNLLSVRLLTILGGLSLSRPYWMEYVIPKKLICDRLKQADFDGAIGLTPYTKDKLEAHGFSRTVCILPGKDDFEKMPSDNSIVVKYNLKGKRFLCFTGAPSPTRGAQLLLQAIDKSKIEDLKVVFLMRSDVGSDFTSFNKTYNKLIHKERVVLIRERMTCVQLKAFFEQAWYVALPFIVIPSEIPLTFFEVMSCGTPILTFENGGTSRYLEEGLLIAKKNLSGLVEGLREAWSDDNLHNYKLSMAKRLMKKHPTWEDVADKWLELID